MADTRVVRVLNPTETSQMIGWLEEQRTKDRAIIDAQQHIIDRLVAQLREQDNSIKALNEEIKRDRESLKRIPAAEDAGRKNRELIVAFQDRVEALERAVQRNAQIVRVENERDRKVLTELQQRIEVVARDIEGVRNRLHYVEANRKAFDEHSTYVLQRLDELFKADDVVTTRVQTLDDARRRIEAALPPLSQQREQVAQEIARILTWQQLAEVRWTHQIAEWRAEMEERGRQAEEDAREARQLSKQFVTHKEETAEIRRLIQEREEQFNGISIELLRVQNQRNNDLDHIYRLEQTIELIKRRMEEQIGILRQIDDWRSNDVMDIEELEGRIGAERQRIDDIGIRIVQLEEQRAFERSVELERMIRESDHKHNEALSAIQHRLNAMNARIQEQIAELALLQQQQKIRELAEMEQQLMELKERHNRVQSQIVFGLSDDDDTPEPVAKDTQSAEEETKQEPEPQA